MKYRKLPVVIEAFKLGAHQPPKWFLDAIRDGRAHMHYENILWCEVNTLEGVMVATQYEDYIVQGIDGELYPCKSSIFEKTYEEVVE